MPLDDIAASLLALFAAPEPFDKPSEALRAALLATFPAVYIRGGKLCGPPSGDLA